MSDDAGSSQQVTPCPWCGSTNVAVREGSTFRWRLAECECGATCGEVRHATLAKDQAQAELDSTADAMAAWNARHLARGST